MIAARRRRPIWKILAPFAAAVLLCIAGLWLWVSSTARRRTEAAERALDARLFEIQRRDGPRPVLRGAPGPGNAWDEYRPALADAGSIVGFDRLLAQAESSLPDCTAADQLLAAHRPAVDGLRRGARCGISVGGYVWDRDPARLSINDAASPNFRNFVRTRTVAQLAMLQARVRTEGKEIREAVDLLLDVCQFDRDVTAEGPIAHEMMGVDLLIRALDRLHLLVESAGLDRGALEAIDRSLEILDDSLPSHEEALRRESVAWGITFLPACRTGTVWNRLTALDTFERISGWMEMLGKCESLPWPEELRVYRDLYRQVHASRNPSLRGEAPGRLVNSLLHRIARTDLRLIRMGARFRASGEQLDLPDPFGDRLRTSASPGSFKAWSRGPDGADDGGTGPWKAGAGRDIVLEIRP